MSRDFNLLSEVADQLFKDSDDKQRYGETKFQRDDKWNQSMAEIYAEEDASIAQVDPSTYPEWLQAWFKEQDAKDALLKKMQAPGFDWKLR